jgi:DNA integrity scanning protein DisA with diadenylate cyclase activity
MCCGRYFEIVQSEQCSSMQLMNAWASEHDTYKTFKGKRFIMICEYIYTVKVAKFIIKVENDDYFHVWVIVSHLNLCLVAVHVVHHF